MNSQIAYRLYCPLPGGIRPFVFATAAGQYKRLEKSCCCCVLLPMSRELLPALLQGDEAFVRQEFPAAVEAYTQSLRHDTSQAAVWANRAAALLRAGAPGVSPACMWPNRAVLSRCVMKVVQELQLLHVAQQGCSVQMCQ